MKKNLYFSVLAAAALLASCSNEMDQLVENTGSGKGVKVNITPVKELPDTRLNLPDSGTGVTWEAGDEFSMLRVGNTPVGIGADLTGSYNAAYSTEDGEAFTSRSVLFDGDHVLVFPLLADHVSATANITVAASSDGSKSLGNRSVYLSQTPVTISAAGFTPTPGGETYNQSGYNKNIKVKTYNASAFYAFKLSMANKLNLQPGDPAVTINKVELIATGSGVNPFATNATLQVKSVTDGAVTENRVVTKAGTPTNKAEVIYNPAIAFEDGVVVRIVTMLNNGTPGTSDYQIVVHTNYGVVTVNRAAMVTKNGQIQLAAGLADKTDTNKNDNLSFTSVITAQEGYSAKAKSVPGVERDVTVDMSSCDIDGMTINNSADLLAAYRAYDLLGKTTANLTLTPDATGNFTLTKAAVKAINDHKYTAAASPAPATGVQLTASATKITLTEFGTEEYNPIPAIDQISSKNLILDANSKWTIDVKDATEANKWSSIESWGVLQLTESTPATPTALTKAVTNNGGTLEFGGNVTVPVALTQTNRVVGTPAVTYNAEMNVADGQVIQLKGTTSLAGTVNVGSAANSSAILATTKGAANTLTLGGTTNVYGSLLNATGCSIVNTGEINVKDNNAGVIIKNNSNAVINVLAKDNNVRVDAGNEGTIKLPVSGDFEVNDDNMGVANYVVFAGGNITVKDANYSVECEGTANLKSKTSTEVIVTLLKVNAGVQVTVPTNSNIKATNTVNHGYIRVFGTLTTPTVDPSSTGTIYRYN